MKKEIWKDIIGFESCYQVSNKGRVKSLYRKITSIKGRSYMLKERILKPSTNGNGYKKFTLKNKGLTKYVYSHKLVAMAFLSHKPCGYKLVVNHIDHNILNNNVENLELVTQRENTSRRCVNYTSKYTGVNWNKSKMKWRSKIWINNKSIELGFYENEFSAHLAYQKKLKTV